MSLAALAAGCSAERMPDGPAAAEVAPLERAAVQLGGESVAAQVLRGRVRVVMLTGEGRVIASSPATEGRDSAHLLSYAGATGSEWNSFFYGTARPGVARVEVVGLDGRGGEVVDGAWIIAFRDRDLAPDDVAWRFLDRDGTVLREGRGIFPPDA